MGPHGVRTLSHISWGVIRAVCRRKISSSLVWGKGTGSIVHSGMETNEAYSSSK